jgi:hypothetical protein
MLFLGIKRTQDQASVGKQEEFWSLFHLQDSLYRWHANILYNTCTYNRLPEDELSDSKHVEDIVKIKILV